MRELATYEILDGRACAALERMKARVARRPGRWRRRMSAEPPPAAAAGLLADVSAAQRVAA